MKRLQALLAILSFSVAGSAIAGERPKISIIIDDLGYQIEAGRRAIHLPGPVAYAVLPGTPGAARLARLAHGEGKEVLVHLPLHASPDDDGQEPIGIHLDMSRHQFAGAFAEALSSVPFAVGINNHRGSLLTRHPGHMRWLMEEISQHGDLFFVDSYTTHRSVALQIAWEAGVSACKRDVFLDPDPRPETLAREFERMKKLARERGSVVAIAHPYLTTLAFLEQRLPELEREGFELVTISEVATRPARAGGSQIAVNPRAKNPSKSR